MVSRRHFTFHRQQHDIHGDALRGISSNAALNRLPRPSALMYLRTPARFTLRRQAIGDQDDLIRLRAHLLYGSERVDETRAIARNDRSQGFDVFGAGGGVVRVLPLAAGPRDYRLRLGIEAVDLKLCIGWKLRDEPVRRVDRATPLRGRALLRVVFEFRSTITLTRS